jgi:hypothetical protein
MSEVISTVQYRDIQGFPGYRVGDDGSVWSCKQKAGPKVGWVIGSVWKKMSPTWSNIKGSEKKKYATVTLCRDGERRTSTVHSLVLKAFVGPCPDGMESRHLDGNTLDNSLGNLCYGTKKQNGEDRKIHGTVPRGEKSKSAKLTEAQVLEIRRTNPACRPAARAMGVSISTIYAIKRGWLWKHLLDSTVQEPAQHLTNAGVASEACSTN